MGLNLNRLRNIPINSKWFLYHEYTYSFLFYPRYALQQLTITVASHHTPYQSVTLFNLMTEYFIHLYMPSQYLLIRPLQLTVQPPQANYGILRLLYPLKNSSSVSVLFKSYFFFIQPSSLIILARL